MPDSVPSSQAISTEENYDGAAARTIESNEHGAIRVLLVNDHILLREGLVSLLEKFKDINVVAHCGDANHGFQYADEHNPDVVITDFSMDSASPCELARRIKHQRPKSQIIFMISQVTDGNLERGLMSGASGFLSKDETLEGIINAIRFVHMGKRYFSEEIKKRLVSRHSYDPNQSIYTPRRALLSPREIEVLCCVAKGMKAKDIGKSLHITAKTVERHKSNIMAKLGLHSQVDLAIYAIKEGYVNP
ncbi:MAG: LuxR C-terminal-related transcriptional regulator [Oligoflexales bacterium]